MFENKTLYHEWTSSCVSCDAGRWRIASGVGRANNHGASARALYRGQTMVEFALIVPVFLLLMLGVVQMVVVGGAALAVNQAAVACARYASLNPSAGQTSVGSYLTANASPIISDSGLQPVA